VFILYSADGAGRVVLLIIRARLCAGTGPAAVCARVRSTGG